MASDQWSVVRFMKIPAIIVLASSCQLVAAQQQKEWHVDRLCGRVEYVKKIAVQGTTTATQDKRKFLRDVQLELYPRDLERTCCNGLKLIRRAVTGRTGHYDFKNVQPGNYWVFARWNDKAFHLPVTVSGKRPSENECPEQGLQIDSDGVFDPWVQITVD